jgi:leucyl/phenylalanyl-tRNA--protein transferase
MAAQQATSMLVSMAAAGLIAAAITTTRPRRDQLFQEKWSIMLQRWLLGTAYALKPSRIGNVPYLLWYAALDILRGSTRVPAPARTYSRPDTFGGICKNPTADTVLAAARLGFFPWCHFGPLKWWTRKERMVLFFDEHHISKRLRRDMKKANYTFTFDQAFDDVILACAGHRSYNRHSLTWITPQIMRLYTDLHRRGHAHSFEVWNMGGELVGGGYGLSIGRVFVTESQFSHEPNTSKMGFALFNYHLAKWGYVLNDGKDFTPTIDAMGFRLIPRAEFEAIMNEHAQNGGRTGKWSVEATLAEVAAWEPKGLASKAVADKAA